MSAERKEWLLRNRNNRRVLSGPLCCSPVLDNHYSAQNDATEGEKGQITVTVAFSFSSSINLSWSVGGMGMHQARVTVKQWKECFRGFCCLGRSGKQMNTHTCTRLEM